MKLHKYELSVVGGEETKEGYVILNHGQQYSLKIGNDDGFRRCDVEISIDGNHVGTFRLGSNSQAVIERPIDDDGYFTFYNLETDEAKLSGLTNNKEMGLVTAIFKPEILRLVFNASSGKPKAGGTGLSGHSDQEFTTVSSLEYDHSGKFVTINLRLGGKPSSDIRPLKKMSTPVPPPLEEI